MDENRHIGAEGQADVGELRGSEVGAPEVVQGEERRGRVRAAAAEPATGRDAFAHTQIGAERRARRDLEGASGADHQIGFGRDLRGSGETLDAAVVAESDADGVGEVDELKDRLQVVVAVGAAARDMQKQIELRRRGPRRFRARQRRGSIARGGCAGRRGFLRG